MQKVGRIFIAVLIVGALASSAYAATDVRAMPDRQVRPGVSLPVWGNAGTAAPVGTGSSNGEPYTWSFSANPDVVVTTDGNLSGVVGNDRYIVENVTFTLINGSTREVITGTLDVGGTTDTVQIDIVDPADPISDTPQENLQVDVNIAIADGLRYAYLNQLANGTWTSNFSGQTSYTVSHTGLCAWAFQNSGHAPSQNTAYSPFVQQALDYLFTTAKNVDISSKAPNRNFHNHLAGTTGINPTGGPLNQNCFDFDENYSSPIAAAAVIASLTPGATVGVGAAAGLTYKQWIEEYTDWSNFSQSRGYGNNDPEGGWYYCSTFDANDHSVNSWMFLALEGAETVFGATFDPAIKDSVDTALVNRQEDNLANPFYGRFGYYSKIGVFGDSEPAYNTTCAGLSGLALEQLPGNKSVGTPSYATTGSPLPPAHLDTHTEKLTEALEHLGRTWAANPLGNDWLRGNHGNHYAMFACCRGLRLNKVTTLTNDGTLYGGAVGPFDWQTNITAAGALTEGYWPYLVRTQNGDGSWDPNPGSFPYDADWDTCSALFCLVPTVFGPPQQECEDPDPRTQGYWHRQCLGMSASDPNCPGIDPGRNGRGPKEPNDPNFCPDYYDCSNQTLEDLGFFGLLTCDALNADPPSDKCEKALKQFDALILNRCSGRLQNGCEVDVSAQGCTSTTVGALIDEIADLIHNGDCNKAAACAAAVNEGDALTGDGGGNLGDAATDPPVSVQPESPSTPDAREIVRPGRGDRREGDRGARQR